MNDTSMETAGPGDLVAPQPAEQALGTPVTEAHRREEDAQAVDFHGPDSQALDSEALDSEALDPGAHGEEPVRQEPVDSDAHGSDAHGSDAHDPDAHGEEQVGDEPEGDEPVGDEPASEALSGEPADAEPEGAEDGPVAGGRRALLEREGEVAADFLETLLDISDADGDIDVDVDGDRAIVSIVDSEEGRVPRRLVGQDGHVLEALQELTRLAVQSATGDRSRLMLDVAGHRAERRAALVAVARDVIAGVQGSGERAELEPMTAFERKVVHDEVLAAGLRSESEGAEPHRFVVVLPA
ncbi:MAG TPA: R3H domain-containing nucleic acid-binding protein [Dermatophilaceae bacterium]|nr:R3H domain-containing nucleic acid-binding protein [Dermatophilaceae bacterium]